MKELLRTPEFWITIGTTLFVLGIFYAFYHSLKNDPKHKQDMESLKRMQEDRKNRTRRVLILIPIFLVLFGACGYSQTPSVVGTGVKITQPPTEKILVADETEVIASGKTSFRIITSNDSIAHKLMRRFENDGMTRFTYTPKKDRHGKYWERTFYFKNESWNIVADYINKHCK